MCSLRRFCTEKNKRENDTISLLTLFQTHGQPKQSDPPPPTNRLFKLLHISPRVENIRNQNHFCLNSSTYTHLVHKRGNFGVQDEGTAMQLLQLSASDWSRIPEEEAAMKGVGGRRDGGSRLGMPLAMASGGRWRWCSNRQTTWQGIVKIQKPRGLIILMFGTFFGYCREYCYSTGEIYETLMDIEMKFVQKSHFSVQLIFSHATIVRSSDKRVIRLGVCSSRDDNSYKLS